ncbi:MAG: hypothetical protein H6891_12395 [Brucellaceae bacterium]|nr:hypothetical protein [Brucellaceae bacterium]
MTTADDKAPGVARERLARMRRPVAGDLRTVAVLEVLSSLLWIGQAAFVADVFAALAGSTVPATGWWGGPAGFALLGLARALTAYVSSGIAFRAAQSAIACERETLVAHQIAQPSGESAFSSAAIASLGVEKPARRALPHPLHAGHGLHYDRANRHRITAFAFSWAKVGLILLCPPDQRSLLLMALVGMAARRANARCARSARSMHC